VKLWLLIPIVLTLAACWWPIKWYLEERNIAAAVYGDRYKPHISDLLEAVACLAIVGAAYPWLIVWLASLS
jgi:hypothetical protein